MSKISKISKLCINRFFFVEFIENIEGTYKDINIIEYFENIIGPYRIITIEFIENIKVTEGTYRDIFIHENIKFNFNSLLMEMA